MSTFKEAVYRHCIQVVENKMNAITVRVNALKESLGNETKSTAGDKYETGRAMIHLEQEQLAGQLAEITAQQNLLLQTDIVTVAGTVRQGSLVQTDKAWFFISIGLGRQWIAGQEVYAISGAAPLGKLLLGSTVGAEISMGSNCYVVLGVL